jgi:hypothetical protein
MSSQSTTWSRIVSSLVLPVVLFYSPAWEQDAVKLTQDRRGDGYYVIRRHHTFPER